MNLNNELQTISIIMYSKSVFLLSYAVNINLLFQSLCVDDQEIQLVLALGIHPATGMGHSSSATIKISATVLSLFKASQYAMLYWNQGAQKI